MTFLRVSDMRGWHLKTKNSPVPKRTEVIRAYVFSVETTSS